MCRERKSASRSLRRWTAPRRRACLRGREQYRHKARSYPTVQSAACSDLLTVKGKERPEKKASCRDPATGGRRTEVRSRSSEVSRLRQGYGEPMRSEVKERHLAFMLRCALLRVSVGTAFLILRDPGLCSPLGSGAGPILIAGGKDKLRDSLAKNARHAHQLKAGLLG